MMKEKNIRELAKCMGLITIENMCQYTIAQLVYMVANKVNELIDEVGQFESDVIETVKTQNENIQYLLDEGLHLEVGNIFDGWIQDGTFDTLINHSALKKVNERIDETNAQLSHDKRELNARIDSIIALPDGATTADAELIDIRIGEDGVNYNGAGSAVRIQFSNIKKEINSLVNDTVYVLANQWEIGYIDNSGTFVHNDTGFITKGFIDGNSNISYTLNPHVEGFSEFQFGVLKYQLDGTFLGGRDLFYSLGNIHNAPKLETGFKYKIVLVTEAWDTFSKENMNDKIANSIFVVKKSLELKSIVELRERVTKLEEGVGNQTYSKFYNFKWNAIGDSITFFDGYMPIVKEKLGIHSYTNNGKSGYSTLMIGRDTIMAMESDYDLITFFMGTNNFGRCDTLDDTRSSCNEIFTALKEKYPGKKIVVMLPIQRWGYTGDTHAGPQPTMTNSLGIALREYCNVIGECAIQHNLPILDLYYNSGIFGGEIGNTSLYLKDGIHPNAYGYKLIAEKIIEFLNNTF